MPVIMYPPMDNENVARTQRASARVHHVTGAYSTTQAVPRTESRPPITRTNRPPMKEMVTMAYPDDSPPGGRGLERPEPFFRHRSLSNSSVSSSASSILSGRESHDGRLRTVSLNSSQTSIESMPPLHNTPGYTSHRGTPPSYTQYQLQNREYGGQYYSWQKPVAKTYRQKPKPGELFAALPGEVLELILVELRKLHLQAGSDSCATCWMRDCCNIAVSNRKFLKYAREALYQHVYIVGAEGQHMKKRTKLNYGSRLVLLRRTLRANPHMAVIVRSLKPPAQPQGVEAEEYNDLVASVVRACPNLERLVGYYPTYNHSFQRLFHALSTRKRLREMDWVLDASPFQRQHRMRPSNGGSGGGKNNQLWAPGDLQPQQSHAFLELHLNWKYLTTLVVHCEPGATLSPDTLLDRTIRRLPSLENLHISHLPHTSFNDASLLALPPLTKLSLSHLPGITTSGLSSFATRSNTASIHTLTLIHMNVESIPTLARIFANLTSLETFSLVQTYAPNMPSDEFIWLFPYLASHTIRKLHWDIPYLPTRATTADTILAKSVSAGGFPALRILRVPNDPEGLFQALCIPRERIDYATDRYRGGQPHYGRSHSRAASHASYGSRGDSPAAPYNRSANSPTSPLFPPDALMMPRDNSNLHQARLAAQARLESARRFPRFFINVIDEDGVLVEKHGVGAFMGDVRSKIHYLLMPDAFGGTDEGGGLVGVADMLKDGGESLVVTPPQHPQQDSKGEKEKKDEKKRDKKAAAAAEEKTREGCSGRWNTYRGMAVDKKDKERWWHQERGRWRGIILS
ncbi:hypothetical protein B0H63DRAFT_3314 [Podospora didyma]|uniref:Uncharacterized protein n=1 Tax=Podospora didyma TaxID=330526 RepID=A0AAE0U6P8_9PEZI|nr:hypothetical protein B0H63DRAFT_3314 [Podospora didyma]